MGLSILSLRLVSEVTGRTDLGVHALDDQSFIRLINLASFVTCGAVVVS
jgi:hypothetical protein